MHTQRNTKTLSSPCVLSWVIGWQVKRALRNQVLTVGDGSREDEQAVPTQLEWSPHETIPMIISCGNSHFLFPLQIVFSKIFEFLGSSYSLSLPPSILQATYCAMLLSDTSPHDGRYLIQQNQRLVSWFPGFLVSLFHFFCVCLAAASLSCT